MTRAKLTLALIENKGRRRVCYKKRKRGLTKKVEELSTLCGVQACLIIYSHFDAEPQIWPPEHSAVMEILSKFRNLSVIEQNKRMMTQETFGKQRISKLQDEWKKLRKVIRHKEIKLFVSECLTGETQRKFCLADLNEMRWSMYFTIQAISRQIAIIKGQTPPPLLVIPTVRTAGFDNGGSIPVVPPGVQGVYPENPTSGMNAMVPPGIGNGYNPAVAPGMPTNINVQNPTEGMTLTLVQSEQQCADFANDYHPEIDPEMPVDYPGQNSTWSMDAMVLPNEQQSADLANGVNDPQNPTSGMNAVVPPEQSVDSSDFDWVNGFDWVEQLISDLQDAGTFSSDP